MSDPVTERLRAQLADAVPTATPAQIDALMRTATDLAAAMGKEPTPDTIRSLVNIIKQPSSEECTSGEHIECDGTAPATDVPGWWDPCTCNCHSPAAGLASQIPEKRKNE
jgi:hypothetical protein